MAATRQRTTPAPVASIEALPKTSWSRLDVALLIGVLACALALSFFRLGDPSLWMDEAYSVELARRPLSTLWLAYSVGGEANMVLYNFLLHDWLSLLALLGIPSLEFAVRLPSAVFAGASAGVVFLLGRQFSSRLTATLAALLFM